MRTRRRVIGLALLELVLVIVVSAAVLVMGLRMYQSFKFDADMQELKANVNGLFGAAAAYYMANCSRQWNPETGPIPTSGASLILDPFENPNIDMSGSYWMIPLADLLPYLPSQYLLNGKIRPNPLVEDASSTNYVVQVYTQYPIDRTSKVSTPGAPGSGATIAPDEKSIGLISFYVFEVAVRIKAGTSLERARLYKNYSGADCLSKQVPRGMSGAGMVKPCGFHFGYDETASQFLVWNRMPHAIHQTVKSDLWQMQLQQQQMRQQYHTLPINYLTGQNDEFFRQYHLCGS